MTCNTNQKYDVLDLGILHPDETPTEELYVYVVLFQHDNRLLKLS